MEMEAHQGNRAVGRSVTQETEDKQEPSASKRGEEDWREPWNEGKIVGSRLAGLAMQPAEAPCFQERQLSRSER